MEAKQTVSAAQFFGMMLVARSTLTLSLSDELDNVMHLELLVTKEDMAKELEKRFKKNAEVIYGRLINLLYEDP